jgi:drug/metabolite transporter (DMT)-like permease
MSGAKHRLNGVLSGSTEDRPALAAAVMIGSLSILSFQDGLVKLVSDSVSLWQFQMMRGAVSLCLLTVLARVLSGSARPRPKRLWAVVLRSGLLACTMILFFGGAPFLTLAEMAAGLYVFPLFVAVLSALVLREHVGPRRILAIAAGFAGTLLILRPGTEAFRPVALMPVCAGFSYACLVLTTRKLCRAENTVTLAFGAMTAMFVTGCIGTAVLTVLGETEASRAWPYVAGGWRPVTGFVLALTAVCALLQAAANLGLTTAYQNAESSWLAPFDYSYLVFATLWGVILWGDTPDAQTGLGMALIAGAGIFVAWRERQLSRSKAAPGL